MTRAKNTLTAELLNPYAKPEIPLWYKCKVCGLRWKGINPKLIEANRLKEVNRQEKEIEEYNEESFNCYGVDKEKAKQMIRNISFRKADASVSLGDSKPKDLNIRYSKCPRGCFWPIDKKYKKR